VKIAAAQIACVPGEVETNLGKIGEFAQQAKESGAELVVFPEMADTGYVMSVIRDAARPWSEGAVPALQEIAKRLSLAIICGVSEREDELIYNSQVFIDASGTIIGSYRKTHLFCAGSLDEKECFTQGDELKSYRLGGFQLGLSICYDLRFPEIYRRLAGEERANVLVVSSAWPFPRDEHLRILTLARAIENQSYAVLANRVGTDERVAFCGSSRIVDPNGVILAAASSDREELVVAEITQDALTTVRSRMAVFADRRNDLYAHSTSRASA
jgi:omega-amidase